jgi:hypothetical protein
VTSDPNTIIGLLAGIAGAADLVGTYFRRDRLSEKSMHLRVAGGFLMLLVSFLILSGKVKFGGGA